jgi:hypothetical protein
MNAMVLPRNSHGVRVRLLALTRFCGAARHCNKPNDIGRPAPGVKLMDITKMLAELRAERDRLDEAILALERMRQAKRHPGRLPKWSEEIKAESDVQSRGKRSRQRSKG